MTSALLGLTQVASGPDSVLRFYEVTNNDAAVGFFANRNHHAIFLAIGIALLGTTALQFRSSHRLGLAVSYIVIVIGAFLMLAALLSGSRAGLIAAVFAAGVSLALYRRMPPFLHARENRRQLRIARHIELTAATIAVVATVAGAFALRTSGDSLSRLLHSQGSDEARILWLPSLWKTAQAFFPLGAGFGSFDPVYRQFEPERLLATTFVNNAHNELLQIMIEGGVPALLLFVVFVVWFGRMTLRIWTSPVESQLPQLGTVIVAILLATSIGDYPLRVPLISSVFAIGCAWILRYEEFRSAAKSQIAAGSSRFELPVITDIPRAS